MNTTKFKKYLDALSREGNSNNILKLLNKIRSFVDWPKHSNNINVLREDTVYLHQLLNILETQQGKPKGKHIIDTCLSILGNCAMEKYFAREMYQIEDNVLSALNHVLKCYPKEDSINGRVFRVLGNVCPHMESWTDVIIHIKPQIITHLFKVLSRATKNTELKENPSEATILMALRILKYASITKKQQLLKTFPVLNTIGSLFIKFSQEWQGSLLGFQLLDETVLNSLITIIYQFSDLEDYSIIKKLKSTTNGNALKELVNVLLLCPRTIIKIIMNFITISKLNSDLPVIDICNKFIDTVVRNRNKKRYKLECVDYIKCLCYLLDHPANKTAKQCGKTISVLIQALEKLNQPTDLELECCVLLFNALNKCQYEEYLVQEQLRCNILDVVLKKLEWVVDNTVMNTHDFKIVLKRKLTFDDAELYPEGSFSVKRKLCTCCLEVLDLKNFDCPMWHGTPASQRLACPSEDSEDNDYDDNYYDSDEDHDDDVDVNDDEDDDEDNGQNPVSIDKELGYFIVVKNDRKLSPCPSTVSDYANLSWASPCSSPRSLGNEAEDSGDYSPVSSEADDTENQLNTNESDGSVEIDEQYERIHGTLPEYTTNRLKLSLIFEITKLVRSFIKICPPIAQLGSEKLLIALLNCSEFFNTQMSTYPTVNLVCDILHSPIYLKPLLKTDFIEKVYDWTKCVHSEADCVTCMDQSCTGKMVLKRLTHLAKNGTGKQYIESMMRAGRIQHKKQTVLILPYIIDEKKTLADILLTKGGLTLLMQLLKEDSDLKRRVIKTLNVLSAKRLEIANPKKVAIDVAHTLATFSSQRSDNQTSVKLVTFKLDDGQHVKADRNLLMEKSVYFTNLLSGSFKEGSEDEVCLQDVEFRTLNCLLDLVGSVNEIRKIGLDTLLDVIALSDRYLMSDICSLVTNYVKKYRMSTRNVAEIYKWSLESRLDLLRVESITYALVVDVCDRLRFDIFNTLFSLGHSDDLVSDINKLIESYLIS
ncbi:unnamed protein product [Psylliodes chrysocephalus]|uniref:BTB domain-containing protein n=1 Tax=Psylliodes chrysocephalus TaxID=3402493 RepID=A0A9P0G684_9CUCU|nr:unnamed protein product [Psylliodes chrysocephala]